MSVFRKLSRSCLLRVCQSTRRRKTVLRVVNQRRLYSSSKLISSSSLSSSSFSPSSRLNRTVIGKRHLTETVGRGSSSDGITWDSDLGLGFGGDSPASHPHPLQHKLIGILGGVGPMAGVLFQEYIIKKTPDVHRDQDHLSVVHFCCPSYIADRNTYLHSRGLQTLSRNPGESLFEVAKGLSYSARGLGMDAVAGVPSVICHSKAVWNPLEERVLKWNSRLRGFGKIELIGMVDTTVEYLRDEVKATKVGVLSQSAVIESDIFHSACARFGIETLAMREDTQKMVDKCVDHPTQGLKALSYATDSVITSLEDAVYDLMYHGADCVVLGSTEVAFGLKSVAGATLIDPMECLATRMIEAATRKPGSVTASI